ARRAVARGEVLFNERKFSIAGVSGLNDELNQPLIMGTCTTCHDVAGIGANSEGLLFDVGVNAESRRNVDLPLYTFRLVGSSAVIRTTDPGRGLISGRWKDMNRFKVPSLRGLSSRAPYFHDGSAASLDDVIDFFNARFQIGLSIEDKQDLGAYLRAL